MKTPDEIKKGIYHCSIVGRETCLDCPYDDGHIDCARDKNLDALAYIQQLESSLAQVERERDAAVYDMNDDADCRYCQRKDLPKQCGRGYCSDCDNKECPCYNCTPKNNNFIWRGVCPENTKEQKA